MALREDLAEFGWLNVATLVAFALMLYWYLVDKRPILVIASAVLMLAGFLADRRSR